jgi:hypothetical protein
MPPSPPMNQGPPVLTKAVLSMILGFLSLPSCFCFAVPSLILGGAAIWLGVWVRQNYRGTTASEFANLYAWIDIILGSIGLLFGLIGVALMIIGGTASIVDALRRSAP